MNKIEETIRLMIADYDPNHVATAYHEAGHTLIACVSGFRVRYATIDTDSMRDYENIPEDAGGYTCMEIPPRLSVQLRKQLIMVNQASRVAEEFVDAVANTINDYRFMVDVRQAREQAVRIARQQRGSTANEIIDTCDRRVRETLGYLDYQEALTQIAARLLSYGRLMEMNIVNVVQNHVACPLYYYRSQPF